MKIMEHSKFCCAAALAVTIVLAPSAQASFDDQARCDPVGDGEHLVIFSARDANKASVQYQISSENAADAKPVVTQLTARYNYPESGGRYEGGEYILLTTNKTVVLIYGVGSDMPGHTECTLVAEAPESGADGADEAVGAAEVLGETSLNVRARSWGGKLRAGPGTDTAQIGSLGEGERVTLIANTWKEMNGYNWFKIRRANGQEGYKWGGILCSNALHVPGLYRKCMAE